MNKSLKDTIELYRNDRIFQVRRLSASDLPEMMQLQQEIADGISDENLFVFTTLKECRDSVENDICIGIFENGRMCAAAILVINRVSERNIASKLELDCGRYVTLDSAFVSQECRGLGFQRYLIQLRLDIARELGAEYALATVSPDNTHSQTNLLSCGFEILCQKPMYHGVVRNILCCRLS